MEKLDFRIFVAQTEEYSGKRVVRVEVSVASFLISSFLRNEYHLQLDNKYVPCDILLYCRS